MKMKMKINFCLSCGTEQQQVGEIKDYIYCERCGSKIYADGSGSHDGSRDGIERMEEQIDLYDRKYRKIIN